jgi:hypothetical protein
VRLPKGDLASCRLSFPNELKGLPRMEPRWRATISYSGDAGPYDVLHEFEELAELQEIVERGPDWNAILDIKIELARRGYPVTVEEAREL